MTIRTLMIFVQVENWVSSLATSWNHSGSSPTGDYNAQPNHRLKTRFQQPISQSKCCSTFRSIEQFEHKLDLIKCGVTEYILVPAALESSKLPLLSNCRCFLLPRLLEFSQRNPLQHGFALIMDWVSS